MKRATTTREIAGLLAGFTLWAAAFVVLYAGHGYACSVSTDDAVPAAARPLLIATYALFLVVHAALAAWLWKRHRVRTEETFTRKLRLWSFVLAGAALLTTGWTGLPVLTLSLCT